MLDFKASPRTEETQLACHPVEHSFVPGSAKNRAALWAEAKDQRLTLCCPPPTPSLPARPCLLPSPLGAQPPPGFCPSHWQHTSQPLLQLASWRPNHPKDTKGAALSGTVLSEGLFINPPFLPTAALKVSPVSIPTTFHLLACLLSAILHHLFTCSSR